MRRTSSIRDESSRHLTREAKERMTHQLLQLGVEYDVAEFSLKSTRYVSVERALHFIYEKGD